MRMIDIVDVKQLKSRLLWCINLFMRMASSYSPIVRTAFNDSVIFPVFCQGIDSLRELCG